MNRDRSLFKHFGLNPDALYWGSAHESYARRIQDAVESRRMVGVVGPFGSGKSMLVQEALNAVPHLETIYIDNSDRERLRIGNITQVMVAMLSNEGPRRDNTTRQLQLARVMGERVLLQGQNVAVVIENAHRLHHSTLLAIKDLRESVRYRGQAFLFSVILVGQEGLRASLERYGEVNYRTRPIELDRNGWMSYPERTAYLDSVYGELIAPATRNRLAALFSSPLELDHFTEEKMLLMRDGGIDVLDDSVIPLSIREQREALKLSLRELERESGVSSKTINDFDNGRIGDAERQADVHARLQKGLDNYVAKKNRPGAAVA